ncbi:hypothetical protein ACFVOO_36410 [Streptomyces rochei]|uniref:hypothetical protein n=1 Tax=Streptomyces rochei TaxID=1928 RepID=UPI0036A18F34
MSPAVEGHAEDHAAADRPSAGPSVRPSVEDHARARIVTDAPLSNPVPVALRYDAAGSPGAVCFAFPGGRLRSSRARARDAGEDRSGPQ